VVLGLGCGDDGVAEAHDLILVRDAQRARPRDQLSAVVKRAVSPGLVEPRATAGYEDALIINVVAASPQCVRHTIDDRGVERETSKLKRAVSDKRELDEGPHRLPLSSCDVYFTART
jgi:hypothetical protein